MKTKEKIRQYLVFKGISMSEFSRKIGVSNRFLASDGSIMSDKIKLIRNMFLDLSMDWLLFDEGEMIVSSEEKIPGEKKTTEFGKNKTLAELNFLAVNTKVDNLSSDFTKFKKEFLQLIEEKLDKAIKNKEV